MLTSGIVSARSGAPPPAACRSSVRPGGRPGAEPVVAAAVEREHGAGEVVARGRGEVGHQPGELLGRPEPPSGTVPATPSTTGFGYLVISVSVAKWPAASAVSLMSKRAHSIASTRVRFSTAARAADECAIPGRPLCGRQRDVHDLAAPRLRDHRPRRHRVGHQPGALHVQADHGAESLGRDVLGGREVLAAGVVHEHVDAPVALEHAVHERAHLLLLADVACHRLAASALGARATVSSSGSARRPQTTTWAPQVASSSALGAAEAAAAAGHERHLSVEQAGGEQLRGHGAGP